VQSQHNKFICAR